MKEIWKPIKDFEYYFISNFGRVKSTKFGKERILKPCTNKDGYLQVNLWKNGKRKNFRVNRLVAEAFLEIPEELRHLKGTRYLQVNHKDEDKTNNNVKNLEWCSAKYNANFGTRNERVAKKLTKPILQFTLDGVFVKEWKSIAECGRNGFNQGNVAACCKGKRNKHKGFIWLYK